jgi:penicillin-binding protein 1A
VYSTAFAQGVLGPDDTISNAPFRYRDPWTGNIWAPKNSNGKYGGNVSVKTAFAWSYNVPAVRTIERVGPATVVDYAKNVFGFTSHLTPYMSLALGVGEVSPLEMAQAFSVFMTGGDRVKPMAITRVIGPDGQLMRTYDPVVVPNVLDRRVAKAMDELLLAVVQSGTGRAARGVPNARGKTGTTQENKDAWFCGYTDGLVGIGWIANERRVAGKPVYEPMSRRVYGGTVTIQMWTGIMKEAHKRHARKLEEKKEEEKPKAPFEDPANPDAEVSPNPPTGQVEVPPVQRAEPCDVVPEEEFPGDMPPPED